MDIEKYKAELEAAIYEGADGCFYIAGNVVEKVLLEAKNQALHIHGVGGQSICDCANNLEYTSATSGVCKNCGNGVNLLAD